MTRTIINRRHLLRGILGGAAVSLALPPLDAMFNSNGTAYAAGEPAPKRLGIWFWGNGVRPDRFFPTTVGRNWEMTEELAPLAHLRDDFTLVTGLDIKIRATVHFVGRSAMVAGAHRGASIFEPNFGTVGGPSIDQIAAQHWHGETLLRSLELGVSIVGGNHTKQGVGTTSWNGPDDVNPAIFSPLELYNKLFAAALPAVQQEAINSARLSVLDAVLGDAAALRQRLGATDRLRLESHMDGLREIERQISFYRSACSAPERPGELVEDRTRELLEEKNQLMAQMLKAALACDLTRAFTYQYAQMQMNTIFWQVGATEGMHVMTHDDRAVPADQKLQPQPERIHQAVVYIMGHLAVLLDALKSVPEGDGTLLDNTLLMATSDLAEGTSHTGRNMPIILAGGAGGSFRRGLHYKCTDSDNNTSRALLTALHASGVMVPSVGAGEGFSDNPLSDLLV
jgi:hypothetical protein